MAFSIQQLPDDSKFSHALRFEVLEQLCPPELVSELLTRCHAWGKRERSLNQLLVVYSALGSSCFADSTWQRSCVTWCVGCAGSGRTRVCVCRRRQRWSIVGGNWAALSCATSSSTFADRWPPSKPQGLFASDCGSWPSMAPWMR